MKKVVFVCCVLLALVMMPLQSVYAGPELPPDVEYDGQGVWLVYPHTSPLDDPQRIQAVVDMAAPGDTVQLAAGAFDFGDFGTVRVAKDLSIEGAWDRQSQVPLTTILRGYMPILIGRKTAVFEPVQVEINGHSVSFINSEMWGRLAYPFAYPGIENYDIHDDWESARVNVRQITFDRPLAAAIFIGAMNGGVIDRIRVENFWPFYSSLYFSAGNGGGIVWNSMGYNALMFKEMGGTYGSELYTGTDLIRGDIVLQNSVIHGEYFVTMAETPDENGLPLAVPLADWPEPPNGDYDGYVLQEVVFAFDAYGKPIPELNQIYWVKEGYGAYAEVENPETLGEVYVERGIWLGVASLYSQANLTLRHNIIEGPGVPIIFYDNGFKGVPFNGVVIDNRIAPPPDGGWIPSFIDVSVDHWDPATGSVTRADPGENLSLLNNSFSLVNPYRPFWSSAVNIAMTGKAQVSGNQINIASGSGISIGWPASQATVVHNTVTGSGDYALIADFGANGNQLLSNELGGFVPAGYGNWFVGAPASQVILYSDENLVVGGKQSSDWVVLDYGLNNKVISMTHQIGVIPFAAMSQSGKKQAESIEPRSPFRHLEKSLRQ